MEDMGSTRRATGASAAAAGNQRPTQGPWYIGRSETHGVVWIDSDYAPSSAIADLYQRVGDELIAKENAEENAAHIVFCVNTMDSMMKMMRQQRDGFRTDRGMGGLGAAHSDEVRNACANLLDWFIEEYSAPGGSSRSAVRDGVDPKPAETT